MSGEYHGHLTMEDGSHVPLTADAAAELWARIEAEDAERKERIPDEASALRLMMDAYVRLKDMGWNDIIYCPKDGTVFDSISIGSTGVHPCHYEGKWPGGSWWVFDGGDLWPAHPDLFRLRPPIPHTTKEQ